MSRNTITASRDDVFIHKKVEHFWKHENYMNDQDTAMSKWYFLLEGTSSQNADGRWKIRSSYVVERKMQRASKRLSISRTKVEAIADNIPKWEECYWCPPRFRNHRTIFVVDLESMLHHAEVQNVGMVSLRFFYMKEMIWNAKLDTYQITVQIFVTTEPPCCENYTRKSVVRINFSEFNLVIVERVSRLFYGDELLKLVVTKKNLSI